MLSVGVLSKDNQEKISDVEVMIKKYYRQQQRLEKINQKGSVYKQNTEGYNYALPDLYRGEMGSDEIETE